MTHAAREIATEGWARADAKERGLRRVTMPAPRAQTAGAAEGDSAATMQGGARRSLLVLKETQETSESPGFRRLQGRWKRDEAKELPGNEPGHDRTDCVAGNKSDVDKATMTLAKVDSLLEQGATVLLVE
jgi:hypothetical protein